MSEEDYEEINRLLRELAEDLELPCDVFERVYVGSGEDFCPNKLKELKNA